jgi:hypothetical protein
VVERPNSTLLAGDLAAEVSRLKALPEHPTRMVRRIGLL